MLVVIIMGVGVRYSFHTGFLEYVNLANVRSMQGLVRSLADAYETENSWDFLRGNQSAWLQLLRSNFKQLEYEFRERELEGETGNLIPPGVRN